MEGVQHDFKVPEHDVENREFVEPDEGNHEVDGGAVVLVEHLVGSAEHGVESVEGIGIFLIAALEEAIERKTMWSL